MTDESNETYELGDEIDDHCTHCRGISGHAVTAFDDGVVIKVMCRTCFSEHKYRKCKSGRSKERERQKLIDEVMKGSPFKPE